MSNITNFNLLTTLTLHTIKELMAEILEGHYDRRETIMLDGEIVELFSASSACNSDTFDIEIITINKEIELSEEFETENYSIHFLNIDNGLEEKSAFFIEDINHNTYLSILENSASGPKYLKASNYNYKNFLHIVNILLHISIPKEPINKIKITKNIQTLLEDKSFKKILDNKAYIERLNIC